MNNTVYRSRIDWRAWLCLLFVPALMWLTAMDMPWWYAVFICGGLTALCLVSLFGCWYEIEGEDLIVYMFFRPLSINKIKSVKKTRGILATAAMSTKRVSISFSDRSVLKSYAQLDISPKDDGGFITQIEYVNPIIEILE